MDQTGRPADIGIRDVALMALTISSGCVDAISYIVLGKVFTAFMTGNIVFLGLHTSHAAEFEVFRIVRSLVSFSIGILVFRLIAKSFRDSARRRPVWTREVTATLVIMVIAQAGFLIVWLEAGGLPSGRVSNILVTLWAFAMGLQTGAVLSLGLPGVLTTAATGTVVALIASIAQWPHPASDWRRLLGVVVCLFAGALLGGLLLIYARLYAPVLPLAGTTLALAIAASDRHKHAVETKAA
jgi:uncharacterized membrane protein YoaK (UPF0700 family)